MTAAHDQAISNRYVIHYPQHDPRTTDPHYKDFNAYRAKTKATAVCAFGAEIKDFSNCEDAQGNALATQPDGKATGLEVHHAHIEFAMQNGIDLKYLEAVYPGVSNPDEVGAWVESATNLEWLCVKHHRASGTGAHHAAAADYEASKFVRNLIN